MWAIIYLQVMTIAQVATKENIISDISLIENEKNRIGSQTSKVSQNGIFRSQLDVNVGDFFIESTYESGNPLRQYKCYELTKKGCEFIANKMTGTKGNQFTAVYVNKFNEMEEAIKPKLPKTYAEALRAYADEVEAKEKLQLENKQQAQMIGELKPKADYTDLVLKSTALVTITQIAKDYGMSGVEMNQKLHDLGIQYKQSSQWLLYSKYQAKGYTQSETIHFTRSDGRTDVKLNTKWTQKGRLFLYQELKKINVLPVIEQQIA